MSLLILLIGVNALIITFYYFRTFCYWKHKGVKSLRPNLLFGNLSGVVLGKVPVYRMLKEVYRTCKNQGDKFMGFYFLNVPTFVIADPELMKQILIKDFSHFTDREFYVDRNDPLTINLASAKGKQWKNMREKLSPAFSPRKLKFLCQTLLQVGDQLKSALDKSAENHEVVNLKDLASKYTVDAIGMGIFGIECNTLKNFNKKFEKFAESTFGGSFTQNIKLMLSILCPSVLYFFGISFSSLETQNFYLNLVKATVEMREKNKIVRNDLMQLIIQLRNNIDVKEERNLNLDKISKNEKSLNVNEITAQTLLFFGAGYETSSTSVSLCIYELASNKDAQSKLRNEIDSILEKHEGKVDYNAIMEMTYLNKCVLETFRKYAVSAMAGRTCTKRYQVPNSDVVIDVGTTLYLPIYEFHHDPEYYPNPEQFNPERFSPENKSMRPNYTFLAFGDGQRHCIGARLGVLQVKIFLIIFLRNYKFAINPKVKLPPTFSKSNMIVSFENPLYLNIQKI